MTYGNTTGEQTTYNSRMQPTTFTLSNMNYQNTTCCGYPTYSTMTWSYGYYDDGSLKHAWDSTNEWFDRAYKYDHAGRLAEASTFRRARSLSPYPAVAYSDPYFQTLAYDAFNHSSRSGLLYMGAPPSDNGTYVNNRRTDIGWEYDAEGNNTRDADYQQTFDAAGALIHSVSHAMVGNGVQYPFQPRLDITQTYNGDGAPAKRHQIARMPGVVDEFGNQSEPIEDIQTTYFVTSSVLGGVAIVELESPNTVHIYAGGQRIAREVWGNVSFEHHNPLTGSWVTSNGHSSYRTTTREERDPRGAEMPLENPYFLSYLDWKFGETYFFDGGDPFDYSSGREIDGLPVSEAEFQRRVANGSVVTETLLFGPPAHTRGPKLTRGGMPPPPPVFTWRRTPLIEIISGSSYIAEYPIVRFSANNEGSGKRLDSDIDSIDFHHPRPQNTAKGQDIPPRNLLANIFHLLDDNRCSTFVSNLINVARQLTGKKPYTYDGKELAVAVARQENGGFIFRPGANGDGGGGSAYGDIFSGLATVEITRFNTAYGGPRDYQGSYALAALHEIIHLAGGGASPYDGSRGYYMDVVLARAANILTGAPGYPGGYDPNMPPWQITAKMTGAAGDYWDDQLKEYCMPQAWRSRAR